jgi:glycosyltransferase involved in cell wall biosynthesis
VRSALLFAHEWPPRTGTASIRAQGLARALVASGWSVRVVTVRSPRAGPAPPAPPGVELLRAPAVAVPVHPLAARAPRLAAALDALLPVDERAPWGASALALALASLARRPADVVLGTGPPFSGVVAAAACARATGAPLVVELRDPWVGNPLTRRAAHRTRLGPLHRGLEARLERVCLRRAARVLVTASSLGDALAARYPGLRLDVVRNGWRDEDRVGPPAPAAGRPARWLYAGAVVPGYSPLPVVEALGRLLRAGRLDPAALRVRLLTDHPGAFDGALAATPGLREVVSSLPLRPRSAMREEYAQADALLLVYPDYPGVPGKLYEYMATRRPVLVVAPPGEARGLLEAAGLAVAVDPGDAPGLERAALGLVDALRRGEALARPVDAVIDAHRADAQLVRAVGVLEEVVDEAGRAGSILRR